MKKLGNCAILILIAAGAFTPWGVFYNGTTYTKNFVWHYSIFIFYIIAMALLLVGIAKSRSLLMVIGSLGITAASLYFFFSLPALLQTGSLDLMTSFTHSGPGVYLTFLGGLLFLFCHRMFLNFFTK